MNEKQILALEKYLKEKKCDGYEIFIMERDHLLADAREGAIESFEEATEWGVAIRILNDQRLGFAYATSSDRAILERSVDNALAASKEVDVDPGLSFVAEQKISPFDWCHFDKRLGEIPVADKTAQALQLEKGALSVDSRVKKVRKAIYEESILRTRLINSEGVNLSLANTMVGGEIMAVAEGDGDSQWGWDYGFSHTLDGIDTIAIGERAARSATRLLGAKPITSRRSPICFHPTVASQLLKILSKGFFGDNICKKKSPLIDKLGEELYSKKLCIINDGRREGGYGSMTFDANGWPTQKTYLVKDGIVSNWLTDTYWGKKLKVPSTGSAIRDSIKDLPEIGIQNLYIEPSGTTRQELFTKMGSGFFVTDVIGAHTINPITGEFSVGAEGLWIENGEEAYPVKGVAIAGSLHDLFKNVVEVGNDLRFIASAGSPTILISELQISGQ